LKLGESFIEWLGRYPTPTSNSHNPSEIALNPSALATSYEAMFFRIVEMMAADRRSKDPTDSSVVEVRERFEEYISGISGPMPGEERLFLRTDKPMQMPRHLGL
jgi:hypothetical protein